MTNFESDELFDFLISEAEAKFSGWDFSYIADREHPAPLRWSYVSEALLRVRKSKAVLDMDTGGGEMFSYFVPLPPVAYATEAVTAAVRRGTPVASAAGVGYSPFIGGGPVSIQ